MKNEIAIQNIEWIKDKIYIIRGEQVMLDFELAEIYGYETKRFNEQVKNNIERFDEDFRFQLTEEEFNTILRCKNSTSSWGGMQKTNNMLTNFINKFKLRVTRPCTPLNNASHAGLFFLPF